jgi:hypothetical protein
VFKSRQLLRDILGDQPHVEALNAQLSALSLMLLVQVSLYFLGM